MGLRRENFTAGNLGMPSVKLGAENNFGTTEGGREETARACHTRRGSSALRSTMWIRSIQDRNAPIGFWQILHHPLLLPRGFAVMRADGTYVSRHDVAGSDRWIAVPRVAATVVWCWHHDRLISLCLPRVREVYIPRSATSSTVVSLFDRHVTVLSFLLR